MIFLVELTTLEKIATSQTVWSMVAMVLAIIGYKAIKTYIIELRKDSQEREDKLLELYEQQRTESNAREERLMTHLENTTQTLDAISDSLEKLEREFTANFDSLEEQMGTVNSRIDDVWKQIK